MQFLEVTGYSTTTGELRSRQCVVVAENEVRKEVVLQGVRKCGGVCVGRAIESLHPNSTRLAAAIYPYRNKRGDH